MYVAILQLLVEMDKYLNENPIDRTNPIDKNHDYYC